MKRTCPKRFVEFFNIAKKAGLSYPQGRALYACNRLSNGWPRSKDAFNHLTELEVLTRCQPETAKRWMKHWIKEGHVKSLRTHKEELRLKRERYHRAKLHQSGTMDEALP